MALEDGFIEHERRARQGVIEDTWGHLAPEKNRSYKGRVVFASCCYDSPHAIISADFGDLDGGPWLYEALHDFIGSFELEDGAIYEWRGTFRNYRFYGTPKRKQLT